MTLRCSHLAPEHLRVPLDDPAFVMALILALRGGRLALDSESSALLARKLQADP
jgi:hypothetical protein